MGGIELSQDQQPVNRIWRVDITISRWDVPTEIFRWLPLRVEMDLSRLNSMDSVLFVL